MQFSQVIGQAEIKRRLIASVTSGRIPHAQLLCGIEGVGKLALAVAYAQYIMCEHPSQEDSCGVCASCIKFQKLSHPDLHFVYPIVKSEKKVTVCDDVGVEFRTLLTHNPYMTLGEWTSSFGDNKQGLIYTNEGDEILRKLSLKSYEGGYKIMIIWHPEKMHESCANRVLKLIEEPPAETLFLLVTDQPDSIITTILSRLQKLVVPPISVEELSRKLLTTEYSQEQSSYLIRNSMGSWVRLKELVEMSEWQQVCFNAFVMMMRLAYTVNLKQVKEWSDEMAGRGREMQKSFLQESQRLIRENFIFRLREPELTYMRCEELAFAEKFSPFIHERNVMLIMDELSLAEAQIEQNANAKILFLDLVLKINYFLKQT